MYACMYGPIQGMQSIVILILDGVIVDVNG